ncbi:AAA family ATPase [Rhizobium sp. CG5]|uniref:AAA family ATPase n=1 Tax=Rhizobium sp. CG5 TaxID=2726076 RepID=UPI0020344737|nr:AAA family ATPase [Rhizobium sp. CG5]MCM2475674.1 AAA family ATPase [Rhizobium sp. CG5]
MLEEICISSVATYPETAQRLEGLKPINFVFGTNGSGKTTISRILADTAAYPTCTTIWFRGRTVETLVYNSDFVENNFTEHLKGIFTLGEVAAEKRKQIEEAKAKVADYLDQIDKLKLALGSEATSTGKLGDLGRLRAAFEERCWQIKSTHDRDFKRAFEGARNSKERFCDRVLAETAENTSALCTLEDLRARAESVFAQAVAKVTPITTFDGRRVLSLGDAAILEKPVVGKQDVDLAPLISRLGNSDWVRAGLHFVEGTGAPCPFCQKAMEAELLDRLKALFDEVYVADIKAIEGLRDSYEIEAQALLNVSDAALSSGSPYMDAVTLRPFIERLRAVLELNKRHIERKRNEPSSRVCLEPVSEAIEAVASFIEKANAAVSRHNQLVENLGAERGRLTSEIWKLVCHDNKSAIDSYLSEKTSLDKAVDGMRAGLKDKNERLATARTTLADLERSVTSVRPTVNEINGILASFGFTSFKLETAGDRDESYAIVRSDGSSARNTLSEGERSFISFLYFYHLIRGSTNSAEISGNRVVVFDDPVSSLDSDVLFIVSALIKRVLSEACSGKGAIKQVFVMTHNIYFHKEVTFDPDRKTDKRAHETFWIVRKTNEGSQLEGFAHNPIRTSYELLWEEIRRPSRPAVTIQNVMRRILEHYFTILGNMDKDSIIEKFEGRDQQVCASLFSWINDGSHNFSDELYASLDATTVDKYLVVFERIFGVTGHGAHYAMMRGPVPITAEDKEIPAEVVATATEMLEESGVLSVEPSGFPAIPA